MEMNTRSYIFLALLFLIVAFALSRPAPDRSSASSESEQTTAGEMTENIEQ